MGLRQYKLTSDTSFIDRYIEMMGLDQFIHYQERVIERLKRMNSGESFDITGVLPETRELFIKTACQFILNRRLQTHNVMRMDDYYFTEDYTQIKRL